MVCAGMYHILQYMSLYCGLFASNFCKFGNKLVACSPYPPIIPGGSFFAQAGIERKFPIDL